MAKFNPNMLIPAAQVADFAKPGSARAVEQVLLDNINKQKALFLNPEDDGKRNFKIAGETVSFTLRVNNTALVLGQYENNGQTADVREMAVPKANFIEALEYFEGKAKTGEFAAQLATLDQKRTARTDKMRTTRAAKKSEQKPS